MKKTTPLISVILPAYNAAKTIAETIQSVLDQDFSDWELLVINDGSKDNTADIVSSFVDERIRLIHNEGNKGLIYTLNRGIEMARGTLLARIDADDVAMPSRFSKQVDFMTQNPNVVVCGTFMEAFGNVRENYVISFETKSALIKNSFPLRPAFGHPSVMMRKSVLVETGIRYDSDFKCAEDAKLWLDLMPFGEYANIPEVLMRYRISPSQCTQSGNTDMIEKSLQCRRLFIDKLTDGWYKKEMSFNKLSVSVMAEFKKKFENENLLIGLYRSMAKYQFSIMLYCICSFDFFKFPNNEKVNIIKRFLGRNYRVF